LLKDLSVLSYTVKSPKKVQSLEFISNETVLIIEFKNVSLVYTRMQDGLT